MSGLGASFLLRRARYSWLLLAGVAMTVLLSTGLAAAVWTFAAEAVPAGALTGLSAPQGRVIALNGLADPDKAASDTAVIRATLHQAWPGIGFQLESALWAGPILLPSQPTSSGPTSCPSVTVPRPGPSTCTTNPVTAQIQPASLEAVSAQATLTAGTWPGPPRASSPVPVALPAAVASQLHLTVGSVLTGTTQSGGAISLQVTGLFRATNPASPYWAVDLLPTSGISVHNNFFTYAGISSAGSVTTYGPAVVNPAAFSGALTATQASWMVLPQAQPMAGDDIASLAASTSAATSQLTVSILPYGLKVTSRLPRLLTGLASTIVLTRSLFTIAALQLLLVAAAGLVLAARLLASLREEESAVLRARGATRWQVARPALAEATALGVVASGAGAAIGIRLTGPLATLGSLRLSTGPASGGTALAWLSALAMLVVCAVVMAWPALSALSPAAARLRRGRQARLAGIARAGGDVALVALAAVALAELRGYSAVAHSSVTGSLGIDPVVAVAPTLALAGVAIIPLRALPLLARLADKATDHERRLAVAMASWQIARRPIRQAGPALLVVVVTATVTLALAGYASWRQSAADQAAFAVGSDVRVDTTQGPLPLGTTGGITQAPGVTAATAASLVPAGNGGQLIALDAATAAKAVLLRPDLSATGLSTLWQRITPPRKSGLALPGRPERLEISATLGAAAPGSAALVRSQLGPASVTAWVQQADGATYQVAASQPLPFDGRSHSLAFPLSDQRQASYPLRLLGLSLKYLLPPYDQDNPSFAPTTRLSIESLAVAAAASGVFSGPFCRGACLAAWRGEGSSQLVPTGPPNPTGGPLPASDGQLPAIRSWHPAAGGGQQLTFYAGHEPSLPVMLGVNLPPGTATGLVMISAQPPSSIVPAIATSSYLAASKLAVGSTTSVSVSGYPVVVSIVASVAQFPTVLEASGALIADLGEVNDVLAANQAVPLAATRWWLSTVDDRTPRLPAGLGVSVTARARQQQALLTNQLLTAPRQALLIIGLAAVLLGMLGFSISVAASLWSRRTQSAVFAALGVGKAAQAGQLCLEQCAISLPAAAAGLLAGVGLAWVLVPAITLTTDAAQPVPWALVVVPVGLALAAAFVTAAVPVAAAALSVVRRPDPAAQLRAEAR
jgi:ABC-type antimicrobial peptide transport system permease subunit